MISIAIPAIRQRRQRAERSGRPLSQAARDEIAGVARQIVKIETAIEPGFQAHFVRAMGFPDSDDAAPRVPAYEEAGPTTGPERNGREV